MMINDALGRKLSLAHTPERIVSLVPSLTEYFFAIGVGDRLVGVTDYCVEPATAIARLPKVRGTKNPDREAIRALQPDLVIANKEENRARDVPRFLRTQVALNDEQAIEMAQLARTLDATMHCPVDIECAYAGGKLYLLQCRPITTLK